MYHIQAIAESRELAEEVVADAPEWADFLNGIADVARTIWDLPDATQEDKIRWIANSFLSAAHEVAVKSIGKERGDVIKEEKAAILAKHEITQEEDEELDFDKLQNISGVSADAKVLVAAGMVTAFEQCKEHLLKKENASWIGTRFNNHAAGITAEEIPASLHRRMTQTVEELNKAIP